MAREPNVVPVSSILTNFADFLGTMLGAVDQISIVPLWMREAVEVEQQWARLIEYAVACIANDHVAWIAAADAAASVCSGEAKEWAAERSSAGVTWNATGTNPKSCVARVVDARVDRLRTSDLLPMHRKTAFAGFIIVFTMGVERSGVGRPIREILPSVENMKPRLR